MRVLACVPAVTILFVPDAAATTASSRLLPPRRFGNRSGRSPSCSTDGPALGAAAGRDLGICCHVETERARVRPTATPNVAA